MTVKYHLRRNYKSLKRNGYVKYFNKFIIIIVCLGLLWIIHLQLRITKLSKFKTITETYGEELNKELKRLDFENESHDFWKTPDLRGWRIYSAYLETRAEVVLETNPGLTYFDSAWAFIRIIGIIPVNLESTQLTCYFMYKHNDKQLATYILKEPSIKNELVAFGENFGMYYSAAYILCPLPYPNEVYPSGIQLPYAVTVSIDPNRGIDSLKSDEFLTIRYPKNGWSDYHADRLFSVCVQPFHHNFDKATDLIAFVEFYRMMGVNRFTFYRDSVSERVDAVLNYYSNENISVLLHWKLPDFYEFERTLRVDGIYAALNDCLYRSVSHDGYKYVVGVDIDEYILPRIHQNFSEMMEHLDPVSGQNCVGAWIFRNTFYYLMHDDDPVTLSSEVPKFKFHSKTRRWEKINQPHDRSKFIVRGENVIELGNHRIWKLKGTWSLFRRCEEVSVDPEVGTSNHYRNCETEIETCWRRKTIVDRAAHRFSQELGQRMDKVFRLIFEDNIAMSG